MRAPTDSRARMFIARVFTLTPPWWGRAAVLCVAGLVLAAAGGAIMLPGASGSASVEVWLELTPAGSWVRVPARSPSWPEVGPPYMRLIARAEWNQGWGWTSARIRGTQEGGGGFGTPQAAGGAAGGASVRIRLPTESEWAAFIREDPTEVGGVPQQVRAATAEAFGTQWPAFVGPGWLVARLFLGSGALLCFTGAGLRIGRESRRAALRDAVRSIARSRCPRCNYELGTHQPPPERTVCPECGTDLTALRAAAESALAKGP